MFGSSRAPVTFVDVLWSLFRGRVELSSFGCNESDDDSNTTAFDGARFARLRPHNDAVVWTSVAQ